MAQTLTQQFVDAFRKGAYEGNLSPEVQTVLTTIAVAVIILSAVGLYVSYARRKRLEREAKVHLLSDPQVVRTALGRARDNRARLDLSFFREETEATRFFSAAIEAIEDSAVVVILPNTLHPTEAWIGRELECFFRLPRPGAPNQPHFYAFATDIRGIQPDPGGDRLRLHLPQGLSIRQKRQHLRITPPPTPAVGLALWPVPRTEDGSLPEAPEAWGPPVLEVQPGRKGPVLLDLSGGGFRLGLPSADHSLHLPQPEEQYLVRMDLPEPGSRGSGRNYLVAAVRTSTTCFNPPRQELGFKFVYAGHPMKEQGNRLQWERLQNETGAEAVDKWVFRRQTERYREKGAE